MAINATEARARIKSMKAPVYLFRDIGCEQDEWASFLVDGESGDRFDLRSHCVPRLDLAIAWLYENNMPLKGVVFKIENKMPVSID